MQDELVGDSASLDSTDQECKSMSDAWDARSDIRTGEIEAMTAAMEVLEKVSGVRNPDTHVVPKKSLAETNSVDSVVETAALAFLQVDSPKEKAVALLRAAAKSAHSGALQRLAEQIQSYAGPFDKIKQMIQKMTFRLQAEQKDEDDHKNWCDLELQSSNDSNSDKKEKIKMFNIKIEELTAKLNIAVKTIKENNDKEADTQSYMTTETTLRDENKAEIKLTIADAQAGAEAVAQAIAVLQGFYKESGMIAKEPWEFIQTGRSSGVKLPEKPSTWGASYTGTADPKNGADGVLSILGGVADKFAAMEAEAKVNDVTDQKNYDQDMSAKKIELADIDSCTQMEDQKKVGLETKLDALAGQLKHMTAENEAVEQYLRDLQPACAPGEGSYADRKQARTDEITALRKAQVILEDAFRAK